MAGERTGEFDRWWHNRGGSPLRGSSPNRPINNYPRNDSPGLRHTPRDWSPFRNVLGGHGNSPREPQRSPQMHIPRQSPRQQHSPSVRTRDSSPLRHSYDSLQHAAPRHDTPQFNSWRRESPLRPTWNNHPSPHHNHSVATPLRDPPSAMHESPITQVSQNAPAPAPAFWPKEFLPPEPDPRTFTPLLPPKDRAFQTRNTLVLDLDETLVHSSFKPITLVDMLIDIEMEEGPQTVYVRKRPYVEDFLARVSELYEVVVLTASLEVYADPVLDQLDPEGFWVHHRLFRDSCANLNGNYIKDLSYLGRPLHEVIIIDNSPTSYLFQPRNAVPISSWFDDPTDTELRELLPVLERAAKVENVYPVLDGYRQAVANGERWYP